MAVRYSADPFRDAHDASRLAPSCARPSPAIGGGTRVLLRGRLPASDTSQTSAPRRFERLFSPGLKRRFLFVGSRRRNERGMGSLLCETVTADSMRELLCRARSRRRAGDMVELRLDGVARSRRGRRAARAAAAGRGHLPRVVGGRTVRRLGRGAAPHPAQRARTRAPSSWTSNGARASQDLIGREPAARGRVSLHDFDGRPADLADRVRGDARAPAPATIKVAVRTPRLCDTLPLRGDRPRGRRGRHRHGRCRRAVAAAGHAVRCRAGPMRGNGVAPGQIPAARMIDALPVSRRRCRRPGSSASSAERRCTRCRR